MIDENILSAAEEIEATVRRHSLAELHLFGDLFEAFELAVNRVYGSSPRSLVHQQELRLIREIHAAVIPSDREYVHYAR